MVECKLVAIEVKLAPISLLKNVTNMLANMPKFYAISCHSLRMTIRQKSNLDINESFNTKEIIRKIWAKSAYEAMNIECFAKCLRQALRRSLEQSDVKCNVTSQL